MKIFTEKYLSCLSRFFYHRNVQLLGYRLHIVSKYALLAYLLILLVLLFGPLEEQLLGSLTILAIVLMVPIMILDSEQRLGCLRKAYQRCVPTCCKCFSGRQNEFDLIMYIVFKVVWLISSLFLLLKLVFNGSAHTTILGWIYLALLLVCLINVWYKFTVCITASLCLYPTAFISFLMKKFGFFSNSDPV